MPVFILRQTIPKSEYTKWMSFFHFQEPDTYEIQLATLSSLVFNAIGGKSKVKDYLINKPAEREETRILRTKGMTDSQVAAAFSSVAKKMV